jgi:hypothetical protein
MRIAIAVVLAFVPCLLAAPAGSGEPSPAHRVRALGPDAARIAQIVRDGAIVRLRNPECRRLLSDFVDQDGRTLLDGLAAFGVSADEYLAALPLLDGSSLSRCSASQSQLLTTPGVRGVFVCEAFLKSAHRCRVMAEVYLIHEMLHTLGLGENPPTSQSITQQVVRRCAP